MNIKEQWHIQNRKECLWKTCVGLLQLLYSCLVVYSLVGYKTPVLIYNPYLYVKIWQGSLSDTVSPQGRCRTFHPKTSGEGRGVSMSGRLEHSHNSSWPKDVCGYSVPQAYTSADHSFFHSTVTFATRLSLFLLFTRIISKWDMLVGILELILVG